jgi:CheY-like chemotaxis protein
MALIANAPRLLVVGRDPLLRKLRAEVLKTRGYSVFPATDYADALSRGKPGAYDAVLVSGEKNEQEALDFCEEVRSLNPVRSSSSWLVPMFTTRAIPAPMMS